MENLIQLYCDASFDKRTKQAIIGYCDNSQIVAGFDRRANVKDNNEAEFQALMFAESFARTIVEGTSVGGTKVEILTDSEDAVRKYNGEFCVKHVPRNMNIAGDYIRLMKEKVTSRRRSK